MGRQTTKRKPTDHDVTRYEDDVYTWVQEQIALLRSGRLVDVDAINVAEELSDLGNEIRHRLESAITILTMHLLKWDYQPKLRSSSWMATVNEQRRQIARLLKRNPGLKGLLDESVAEAYADGRDRAVKETGLPYETFPETCPYTFADMLARPIVFATKRQR